MAWLYQRVRDRENERSRQRRTGRNPGARSWRDEPWTGEGPEPTPQRHEPSLEPGLAFDAIADAQHLECAIRPWCLRRAAAQNWPGFACGDCPRYAAQDPDNLRDERRILFALGRVLVDGPEAVEHREGIPARPCR